MSPAEIIRHIEALPAEARAEIRDWLLAREGEETEDMVRALDAAAASADRGTVSIDELRPVRTAGELLEALHRFEGVGAGPRRRSAKS